MEHAYPLLFAMLSERVCTHRVTTSRLPRDKTALTLLIPTRLPREAQATRELEESVCHQGSWMLLGSLIAMLTALSAAVLNNPTKHRTAPTHVGGAMDLPYGNGKDRSSLPNRMSIQMASSRPGQSRSAISRKSVFCHRTLQKIRSSRTMAGLMPRSTMRVRNSRTILIDAMFLRTLRLDGPGDASVGRIPTPGGFKKTKARE